MERSETEKVFGRLKHVLQSEDWEIWRDYIGIKFRSLVYAALNGTDDVQRLSNLDKAWGILQTAQAFELEGESLDNFLHPKKMDEDNKMAAARRRRGPAGPRPYVDEENEQ